MRPFSNYSSTTTTALAFLTTIPPALASSSSSSSSNLNNSPTLLLPPFNSTDSKLITKCSIRAQQKQRKNQNIGKNSISTSLSLLERLGMGEEEQNVEPPSLSVLPIRQVRYEHAHRRGALYCKSGNWLEISNNNNIDGSVNVRGTRNKNNNHFTIFEFLAVAFGLVSIRAVANQHFLCMDSKGNLYASPEKNYNAECVFLEEMHPQVYNLYSSCSYGYSKRPWFVALSRNGRPRRGKSTKKGQMSTHFVLIDEGNNNKGGNPLDSLGHSKSNADWLINWKNFYEINYEHKIRGRKTIKKGRLLRWELINNNNGIVEEELRKRRSEQKIIRKNRK